VHGNAATPHDAKPATVNAVRARGLSCGANSTHPTPNEIIPLVTIHRFSAPSSANLLIGSSTGL